MGQQQGDRNPLCEKTCHLSLLPYKSVVLPFGWLSHLATALSNEPPEVNFYLFLNLLELSVELIRSEPFLTFKNSPRGRSGFDVGCEAVQGIPRISHLVKQLKKNSRKRRKLRFSRLVRLNSTPVGLNAGSGDRQWSH